MGFNFHMLGMAAVVVAVIGFLVYHYRKKNNKPLVASDRTHGYEKTPYGNEFPTDCPCGCGLKWAGDMPYPPHYTTPPYVQNASSESRTPPGEAGPLNPVPPGQKAKVSE